MAAADLDVERWSAADAADLYEVARWGNGYFSVGGNGHLLVHPSKDPTRSIDLEQLIDRLQVRGVDLPILLRFGEILQHRLREINDAFAAAMKASIAVSTAASTRSRSISSGR
jgi:arginine decarboxylase